MMDIVERLRAASDAANYSAIEALPLFEDAANEILRLRVMFAHADEVSRLSQARLANFRVLRNDVHEVIDILQRAEARANAGWQPVRLDDGEGRA